MKRLIVLVVLAIAGWYGWHHYNDILHPRPRHQAIVHNESGLKLVRVRLTVGGRTFVKEELANGETATFPFVVDSDSPFELLWEYDTNTSQGHWSGGLASQGPIVARHTMTIGEGGGVVYESQDIAGGP